MPTNITHSSVDQPRRRRRERKVPKARVSPGPRIPTTALTGRDQCQFLYDESKARIGSIIALDNGNWAAWNMREKLGEFEDPILAERAVLASYRTKQAAKAKAWEVR